MNVIKLKDQISDSPFFNEKLKGKYAIAFNFNYIFPLGISEISEDASQIIRIEKQKIGEVSDGELHIEMSDGSAGVFHEGSDYVRYDDYIEYIEIPDSLDKYLYLNKFVTDEDITLDDLKRFRTWLAEVLYANDTWIDEWSKDPDKLRDMLLYYIHEMYDRVVKSLIKFNSYVDVNNISKQSGCGCFNNAVTYTADVLSVCDPLLIYRHNIYKYMIEIFSDVSYWLGQEEICGEMKKYIDNIIKSNLPLTSVTLYDKFVDCTCINIDANEQDTLMNILKRLSLSLGYIINHNTSGNRNYIASAFLDWSTYLYEKMRW